MYGGRVGVKSMSYKNSYIISPYFSRSHALAWKRYFPDSVLSINHYDNNQFKNDCGTVKGYARTAKGGVGTV